MLGLLDPGVGQGVTSGSYGDDVSVTHVKGELLAAQESTTPIRVWVTADGCDMRIGGPDTSFSVGIYIADGTTVCIDLIPGAAALYVISTSGGATGTAHLSLAIIYQ